MPLIVAFLFIALVLSIFFFLFLVGTLLSFVPWILIGLLAGWLGSRVTGNRQGTVANILVGLAGSVIGGVLYVIVTGHSAGGPFTLSRILAATAGAIILLLLLKGWRPREAL